MYFPSPLPTTRLSVSTSALPSAPSPLAKAPTHKPQRGGKGKFKESLGGVLEEEGEEILSIVRGPDLDPDELGGGVWAVLAREELTIWSIRVSRAPLLAA